MSVMPSMGPGRPLSPLSFPFHCWSIVLSFCHKVDKCAGTGARSLGRPLCLSFPFHCWSSLLSSGNNHFLVRNVQNGRNSEKTLEWSTILSIFSVLTVLTFRQYSRSSRPSLFRMPELSTLFSFTQKPDPGAGVGIRVDNSGRGGS